MYFSLIISLFKLLSTSVVTPNIVTPGGGTGGTGGCQQGLERCCQGGPYQCGVRYPPVQGARQPAAGQAAFGAYPWQAVLLGPGDIYAGSGALIDNLNVLTAAHKVTDYVK